MDSLDFNTPIFVHFIGIGGISMSGLAQILLDRGFRISGSDSNKSEITEQLKRQGMTIYYGHSADNISKDVEVVVYTAAIKEDNEELQSAYSRGIPVITRAKLLGLLMDNYSKAIAISGTHGKTTTTSMISQCLVENNTDPTISVGGILDIIHGNLKIGKGELFVAEACEYMNSFLEFRPLIAIILNIEEDHLDFFKDIKDIRNSFKQFSKNVRLDGTIIINSKIDNYKEIVADAGAKVITVGTDDSCDYFAENIRHDNMARACYVAYRNKERLGEVQLSVPGEHNVDNSLAMIAACMELGIGFDDIAESLLDFKGAHRRFEYKGEFNQVKVIDDYAHHPTEIKASLKAAKEVEHNEIWLVFQPHTYTRTKALFDDFVEALSEADHVIMTDIYAAREKNTIGINASMLKDALVNRGVDAYYISDFDEIANFAQKKCKKKDMFITMGAGNVVDISNLLVN